VDLRIAITTHANQTVINKNKLASSKTTVSVHYRLNAPLSFVITIIAPHLVYKIPTMEHTLRGVFVLMRMNVVRECATSLIACHRLILLKH
jgi:hypothetical protein